MTPARPQAPPAGAAPAGAARPVFAVVGRVIRGKSSISATLAEDDSIAISPLAGTTRQATTYDVSLGGERLFRLVDTPGFGDAARALAWMQQSPPSADRRAARVAELCEHFAGTDEFVEERELLGPVLDGAAILYVVDGSTPFRENIMAEVEILRWTGRPRMALVNKSAGGEHLAAWHAALAPAFSTVRNFDAHAASFRERRELLALFRELVEPWRAPLARAGPVVGAALFRHLWRAGAAHRLRARERAHAVAATGGVAVGAAALQPARARGSKRRGGAFCDPHRCRLCAGVLGAPGAPRHGELVVRLVPPRGTADA